MSTELNKIADSLFEKIRSRFEDISLGDENAKATQTPENARFFNFDYVAHGKNHGNITISIIDERSLKIYFSKNISSDLEDEEKQTWYNFLRELRFFAKRNLLNFEPRDITRSTLKHRDISHLSKDDGTYSRDEISLGEGWTGTKKSSYESKGPVKIIVRHSKPVDEDQRGARSRNIQAIFLETHEGERFKLPENSLKLARAMARHMSEGGTISDEFGQHILEIAQECSKLRPFKNSMIRRTFEDIETQQMAEAAFEYHAMLNNTLKRMSGKKGYQHCKENFKADNTLMDDFDIDELKERFVRKVFNDKLEGALPLVQKAYNMKTQNKFAEQFESWADNVTEGTWDTPQITEVEEFIEVMSEPLLVGVDAINAINALEGFIGDDELFDELVMLADENPKADARATIMNWLQHEDRQLYDEVLRHLDEIDQPELEVAEGNTYGAAMGGVDGTVVEDSHDSKDAVMNAIIRRILYTRPDILKALGPSGVIDAAEDIADFVGEVDEIGTSDVGAWVKQIEREYMKNSEVEEGMDDVAAIRKLSGLKY
jgi:hypothetical protein